MSSSLLLAFGLFCVFEGVFPFLAPGRWRETFLQLARLSDGQIRFFGLAAILFGILLLAFRFAVSEP